IPQVEAEEERNHQGDRDRDDGGGPRFEENERNDRQESGDQRRDPVDESAQDRRELERLPMFLAQPCQHGPFDRADVELILDSLRFVRAVGAAPSESVRGVDGGGGDVWLVLLLRADVRSSSAPSIGTSLPRFTTNFTSFGAFAQ